MVKHFEWPLVRKVLYKCSPFTIYKSRVENSIGWQACNNMTGMDLRDYILLFV